MLTVLITVGVTVGVVALLHGRILTLNAEPTKDDENGSEPGPTPLTFLLSERIVSITTTGFIFLLAFTLGNLWSNHRTAEQAMQTEIAELARAAGAAQFLPPVHRDPILAAVDAYFTSVREVQWTYMEAGDAMGALRAQSKASGELVRVAAAAAAMEGAESSSAWSSLSTAIDDALASSTARISQIPSPRTTSVLLLVCGLGLVNLAMVAAFYPAPLRRNLFLMGVMAAITATLVFVVVEASNPYLGSGALKPTMYTFPHGSD